MTELDPIVKEFLVESHENLDQLDRDFVALEKAPEEVGRLASIFRTIHTIKGTCGFFGFANLEALAHAGENLLGRLRDRELALNTERASALLAMVDAVRKMLATIEATGADGDNAHVELIDMLGRMQADPPASAPSPAPAAPVATRESKPKSASIHDGPPAPGKRLGEILLEYGIANAEDVFHALGMQAAGDRRPIGEILVERGGVKPHEIALAQALQQETRTNAISETSVRVDVALLDKLMNLVGELVLARNQVLQFTTTLRDPAFLKASQRLNLITTELQENVMKTRMQPIGNVWNRFPRIVRDLAAQCQKQVRVEMEGQETEIDRTIIESIKDPLTHLIRNSVDHGIEAPEVRAANGKPAEGVLRMRAFHEGGQVNIEISDDGAGIPLDRVKAKAIERGLIARDQAARMAEREILQLVFLPGFSTVAKVSNLSGRGVGMDVVKTNIEKIGGAIDIQSTPGMGTTLKIKIPLTLAIIPALIVTSGGDRYAIPQVSLVELVRLEGEQAARRIEDIHHSPVYRLRGNLLPLIYLNEELQVAPRKNDDKGAVHIVVLQADGHPFGLVVDAINDTQEIVVKPLAKQLKSVALFAGATIMGDGQVALILDVLGIAQRAGVVSPMREHSVRNDSSESSEAGREQGETLLIFGIGKNRRMALPLNQVARLEEIPASRIEWADGREVVQYRRQIMPLLRLANALGIENADETPAQLQVVVNREEGRSVGIVVESILDIVESPLDIQTNSKRPGILGSAVIQNKVTDVLDIKSIVDGMFL